MTDKMEPKLGQLCFGTYQSHKTDDHAEALILALLKEISRVYWNINQREWHYEDPEIPGLETRGYYWGDDEQEQRKPNLAYAGVEISWYKYPGRSMSVNKELSVNEWAYWFYSALTCVRDFESAWDKKAEEKEGE